eukprot:466798-Pleurochrysis_carterae.AAC.2
MHVCRAARAACARADAPRSKRPCCVGPRPPLRQRACTDAYQNQHLAISQGGCARVRTATSMQGLVRNT